MRNILESIIKPKNKLVRHITLCPLLVCLVGCLPAGDSESAPRESEADGMEAATRLQREGHYSEAAAEYRSVLRHDPDNALAHFELGILLQDSQNDPSAATYHFRSFLDLKPDAELARVVNGRLRDIEGRGKRTSQRGSSSRALSDNEIISHIEELNGKISQRDRTIREQEERLATLLRENERLGKEVRSLGNRLNLMLAGAEKASRAPRTNLRNMSIDDLAATLPAPSVSSAPPKVHTARRTDRTYRVRRGDSLWSIAQKVYGDPSRSADIRNANRRRIGTNDRLTEGDELVIPFP